MNVRAESRSSPLMRTALWIAVAVISWRVAGKLWAALYASPRQVLGGRADGEDAQPVGGGEAVEELDPVDVAIAGSFPASDPPSWAGR